MPENARLWELLIAVFTGGSFQPLVKFAVDRWKSRNKSQEPEKRTDQWFREKIDELEKINNDCQQQRIKDAVDREKLWVEIKELQKQKGIFYREIENLKGKVAKLKERLSRKYGKV